ncbi:MAG: hypothetical protein ACYC69_07680 [Thermodesulfovibrionales bacterium]
MTKQKASVFVCRVNNRALTHLTLPASESVLVIRGLDRNEGQSGSGECINTVTITEGKRKELITVVIPAYTESGCMLPTIPSIDEFCRRNRDNTHEVVLRGKGYAIRRGVMISGGDIILVSDAIKKPQKGLMHQTRPPLIPARLF